VGPVPGGQEVGAHASTRTRARSSGGCNSGIRTSYAVTRAPCTVVTWLKGPVWTLAPCAVSQASTCASASTGSPCAAHHRAYAKKSRSIGAAAWASHSNRLAAQVSEPAAGSGGGDARLGLGQLPQGLRHL
jgi:hypothetical protein